MGTGVNARRRSPVNVFKYLDYRAYLEAFYKARKQRGYSYRTFSRIAQLGAPNYLKLVIDGKRNLTPEMAKRFAVACNLTGDAAAYFEVLVIFNQAKTVREREEAYGRLSSFRRYRSAHRLDLAHAAYHSHWYIPAIRELVVCDGFVDDPAWIAEYLRPAIRPQDAKKALEVLLELGLLERDPSGKLVQRDAVVTTGPEARGVHIAGYHRHMLERAGASIDAFKAVERDISALTLSVGPRALADIKRRLANLRRELLELSEAEPKRSQVIQLNLQLFPLTRSDETDER